MAQNKLAEFWSDWRSDGADFLHPEDRSGLRASQLHSDIRSYQDYIDTFCKRQLRPKAFHPHLLPQPYHGDLANADIVILLINPGLDALDYMLEEQHPKFREQLALSISQQHRNHIFLDPEWAWTTGFSWWYSKLRTVLDRLAQDKFSGDLGKALRYASERICSIELVPYHSTSFGGPANLPSAEAAKEFVRSIGPERQVILTRGAKDWALPERDNLLSYPATHARSASLSVGSEGGKAILGRLLG